MLYLAVLPEIMRAYILSYHTLLQAQWEPGLHGQYCNVSRAAYAYPEGLLSHAAEPVTPAMCLNFLQQRPWSKTREGDLIVSG
jgi:hypothetical protein